MDIVAKKRRLIGLFSLAVCALAVAWFVRSQLALYSRSLNRRHVSIPASKSVGDLAETYPQTFAIPDEERLTVEETIGLVVSGGGPSHVEKRVNPQAIPRLWQLLEIDDDGICAIHAEAYKILGYIGDDADAARMVEKLRSYKGVLNAADQWVEPLIISGLGIMALRGIGTAVKSLDEMSDVNYWKGRFQYVPDDLMGDQFLPPELETVCRVYCAQAFWRKEEWEPKLKRFLSGIKNKKHQQLAASHLGQIGPIRSFIWADVVLKERKKPTESVRQIYRMQYERREQFIRSTSRGQREVWKTATPDWLQPRPLPDDFYRDNKLDTHLE